MDHIKKNQSYLEIGACVTLQQLIDDKEIPDFLKKTALFAGSRTLRNMATVGGNIGVFRDDSYILPALIAAKARIITADITENGSYIEDDLPIREYVDNRVDFSDSLVLKVILNKKNRFTDVKRFSVTKQSACIISLAFGAEVIDGKLNDVRIVVESNGSGIERLHDVENGIMSGSYKIPQDLIYAVSSSVPAINDFTGSAEYKKYLAGVGIGDLYEKCLLWAKGVC